MKPQHFDWTTPEGLPIIRGAFARMLAKGLLSMAYELHDAVEFNETYNIGLKAFDVLPNEKKVWLHHKVVHRIFTVRSECCARTLLIDAVIAGAFYELGENISVEIDETTNNPSNEQVVEWRYMVLGVLKLLKLNININDDTVPQNCNCENLDLWRNAIQILRHRVLHDARFDVEEYLKRELERGTILQAISSINEHYYTTQPELQNDFNARSVLKESTLLCEKEVRTRDGHRKKVAERRQKAVDLAYDNRDKLVIGPQKMPLSGWDKYIPAAFCIDGVTEKELIPSCQWYDLALSVFRVLHIHAPSILEEIQRERHLGMFLTTAPETRFEPQRLVENIFMERCSFSIISSRLLKNWFSFYDIPFSSFKVWLKPIDKKVVRRAIQRKGRRKTSQASIADTALAPGLNDNPPVTASNTKKIDSSFQNWLPWSELKKRSLCEVCHYMTGFYRSIIPSIITNQNLLLNVQKCLDLTERHASGKIEAKIVRHAITDLTTFAKKLTQQEVDVKAVKRSKAAAATACEIARSIIKVANAVLAEKKAKTAYTDESSGYNNVYESAYASQIDEAAAQNMNFDTLRNNAESAVRKAKKRNGDYGKAAADASTAKQQAIVSLFKAINAVVKVANVAEIDYQKFISNQQWQLGNWHS